MDQTTTFSFYNADGWPVYRVVHNKTGAAYLIVVTPDRKQAYYADAQGRPSRPPSSSSVGVFAVLGGIVGLIGGPAGALIGAGVGGLLGSLIDNGNTRTTRTTTKPTSTTTTSDR